MNFGSLSSYHEPYWVQVVYHTKYKADGTIDKYKARLIAKGFHQQYGLDYGETFSPVVKATTIQLVLSLAFSQGWHIRQLDVNKAFLHGYLNEAVYMTQPQGFVDPSKPNHVCKLNRSLYGLKQTPRVWFNRLSYFLINHGFIASKTDSSLFIYAATNTVIYILVYVDDILITSNESSNITMLVATLAKEFSLKDLGPLHYFLGIEVTLTKRGMFLSQKQYITNHFDCTGMMQSKPVQSPIAPSDKPSTTDGIPFSDPTKFRKVMGALQYLTLVKPDLAYFVNNAPTDSHWALVKRILRYLKHTISYGLFITSPLHYIFKHTQIQIGPGVPMIESPQVDLQFILATT